MKKITNFLFSTRLMSIVVVLFAAAMAVATFIENDYGTQTAKALIYNSWWFEALMYLLTLNFIGNIVKYRLYRREKWPVFLFHIAFIVTLVGAFITRYVGYEGMMPIRENAMSNSILSDKTYVQIRVDDGKEQKEYEKEVLFGALSSNHFSINSDFRGKSFSVNYMNYIRNAKSEFVENEQSPLQLHIVISDANGRNNLYIKDQSIVTYKNQIFSFNKPTSGAMNFFDSPKGVQFQPALDGTYMVMQTREKTKVLKDSIAPMQLLKLYDFPSLKFVIPTFPIKGEMKEFSAPVAEKNQYPYDLLNLNITSGDVNENITIKGAKNAIQKAEKTSLNGLNFTISYGSKLIKTPFSIKLRDFELERYPGTNSASSYASEVTVIDRDKTFDYRIFMNHVLDYKGYRFFQASYDKDEKGTVLSVNHDYWGTLITYLGYFLMGLGMFFTLFWKGTRFKDLSNKLKKISKKKLTILLLLISFATSLQAQDHSKEASHQHVVDPIHAEKFGKLLIQDHQGRIKPINTYALENLRKIYKKDSYEGLSAEQVILTAQLDPMTWGNKPIIHIKPNALGKELTQKLKAENEVASIANFYEKGQYFLSELVNVAYRKKNMDRTATDKEIINLDERANIWLQVLNGSSMSIYPKKDDSNNKWFTGYDNKAFVAQDTMVLKMHQLYMTSLHKAIETKDYKEADIYLETIKEYQNTMGAAIIPASQKIDLEVKYNHWNIFKKLLFYYMILGFVFLLLAFANLFKPSSKGIKLLLKIFSFLTILGMLAHVIGLGLRWYISGHAPWSNGYEAVVFVAFVTTLAGLIFSHKKSKFTLASTVLFASFLLGIAHGSMMNPEISNLVPVLKSYWLMIHVAIITASYGFLGLGALLGFVVLLLYILRTPSNAKRFNNTINELTYINESTLIVGLFTLSIGTFLGGVWASESWGRYWSWDPKEVWSLISMMVYIFVLHMRLVPGLRGKFAFNTASLFSIGTLIMTFFGVNFYLSGMHSYAAGDPVPIPVWIYYAIAFFVLFAIISFWRYKKFESKK